MRVLAAHNNNLLRLPHCIVINFPLFLLSVECHISPVCIPLSPRRFPFLNVVPSFLPLFPCRCRVGFPLPPGHSAKAPSWGLFFAPSPSLAALLLGLKLPHQTLTCLLICPALLFIPYSAVRSVSSPLPLLSGGQVSPVHLSQP